MVLTSIRRRGRESTVGSSLTDCNESEQSCLPNQKLMSTCVCWNYPKQEAVKRVALVSLILLSHIAEAKVNKYAGRISYF